MGQPLHRRPHGREANRSDPSNQKIRRHPRNRLRLLGVLVIPQQPARLGVLVLAHARLSPIEANHAPRARFCLGGPAQGLGSRQHFRLAEGVIELLAIGLAGKGQQLGPNGVGRT